MNPESHQNSTSKEKLGYSSELSKRYSLEVFTEQERENLLYPTFLRTCGNVRDLQVLDVGCGAGTSSRPLARRGAHVLGVDASSEQIALARELEKQEPLGIEYIEGYTISELPVLRPEGFDLITASFILNYARTTSELGKMFANIYQNLKPGTRIVGLIDNPSHPLEPGPHFPKKTAHTWVDSSHTQVDGAQMRIQLFDSENNPIPSFTNFYYTEQTIREQAFLAGFNTIFFHATKPPEQESVIAIEAFKK